MPLALPQGFRFSGIYSGVKTDPDAQDLSLIVSEQPAVAAGVYTQNIVYSAPVEWDRKLTPSDNIRAVVTNSGNANACTGDQGWQDVQTMAEHTATVCGAAREDVLVMSTGIIGEAMPMDKVTDGISAAHRHLGEEETSFLAAADGILTTDTARKVTSRTIELSSGAVRLAGMAKGAGMIGPNMATMLAVFLTDAALDKETAHACLAQAVDRSFNCISVEGHTSTSDTALLLANGAANSQPLTGADLAQFQAELNSACIELAKMIPDDGEGASHLIEIHVAGCRTQDDAMRIAKTLAQSALVKTAVTGADPNWGRIVSAAGYAGVDFDPTKLSLALNDATVFQRGQPTEFDAAAVSQSMRENRTTVMRLEVGAGHNDVTFWTSDLTVEYVRFNSDYHT